MVQDRFLTKSLTTSGTSSQSPTGPIVDGGSNVDEWDVGLLDGTENLYLVLNVTDASGTNPSFTPSLESDTAVTFGSPTTVWTAPAAITTTGLNVYKLPAVRERYLRLVTGTISGTSPAFTFTAHLTTTAPSGRL